MTAFPASPRLGFCCKWLPPDGDATHARAMNQTDTTVAALMRRAPLERVERLLAVVGHNVDALVRQLEWLAQGPPQTRMMRIVSSLLPGYTHPDTRGLYAEPVLRERIETGLARAGAVARGADIRLGMHPSQFCVLATLKPDTLKRSVADLEYHADIMRGLGLSGGWHPQGAHINVHVGARAAGIEGFRAALPRLSAEARGLVTVENDEMSFGIDDVLLLADALPIVLDIHHHWVRTGGERIEPDDPRVQRIIGSWRGVRPVAHVSAPCETLLAGHAPDVLPDFAALVAGGHKPRGLRMHSHGMWNRPLNAWALRHLAWADLEIEAKGKNLAVADLMAAMTPAAGRGA